MIRARVAMLLLACVVPACDTQDAARPQPRALAARETASAPSPQSRSPRSVVRRIVARQLAVPIASIDDHAPLTSVHPAADDTHVVEIVSAIETELSVAVSDRALERLAGGHHSLASTLSVDELVKIVESASD